MKPTLQTSCWIPQRRLFALLWCIAVAAAAANIGNAGCDRSPDAQPATHVNEPAAVSATSPSVDIISAPRPTLSSVKAKTVVDDDNLLPQPTTLPAAPPIVLDDSKWEPLFKGIDYRQIVPHSPRKMHIHVARINMRTPGLRFFVTPAADAKTGTWSSMTTSHFLAKYKVQLAINASAAEEVYDEEGQPQKVISISVSDGHLESKFRYFYASLMITADNHARIDDGSKKPDLTDIRWAVAGFAPVEMYGKLLKDDGPALHPRTGAGVTADGNTLFLVVIDGRQPFYSQGATTHELGEIFKLLGADCAMNLDGGGSTAMVIQDKDGQPVQLDSPVNHGVPGNERPVPNHFGVYADPP